MNIPSETLTHQSLTWTFFSYFAKSQVVMDEEAIRTKEAEMEVLSWASNFSIHAIETFIHVLARMQASLLRYENRDKVRRSAILNIIVIYTINSSKQTNEHNATASSRSKKPSKLCAFCIWKGKLRVCITTSSSVAG